MEPQSTRTGQGSLHRGCQSQLVVEIGDLRDPAGDDMGNSPLQCSQPQQIVEQFRRRPPSAGTFVAIRVHRNAHQNASPIGITAWPQGQHPAPEANPGPLSAPVGKPLAWFSAAPSPEATPGDRRGPLPR